MKRKIILFSILAVGIILLTLLAYAYKAATSPCTDTNIYITSPTSLRHVDPNVQRLLSLFGYDSTRIIGFYKVEHRESALSVAKRIRSGAQTPIRVTINNMRTIDDLIARLAPHFLADQHAFYTALDTIFAHDSIFDTPEKYPAAFFPETFEFYWTDKPEKVFNKIISHRNSFWSADRLAKANALGLSPLDVTIIASIVEEESNKPDEYPIIARLYINRLHRGMKLQADPTVKFALQDFSITRITHQHLQVNSPYNTYLYEGLPPGPIRIVNKTTIDAVLNAPEHNYLYMCAKEDFSGYHNFAADYSTHLRNAARYHNALNRLK